MLRTETPTCVAVMQDRELKELQRQELKRKIISSQGVREGFKEKLVFKLCKFRRILTSGGMEVTEDTKVKT